MALIQHAPEASTVRVTPNNTNVQSIQCRDFVVISQRFGARTRKRQL